jgi:hypothetical protein
MNDQQQPEPRRRQPLQFGLRTLLALPVAVGLLFGTLRWLDVSPLAQSIVLVILMVSAAAALGLLVAVAAADDDEP